MGNTITKKIDRKSTRLNSSHGYISYAVFCLKKKKKIKDGTTWTTVLSELFLRPPPGRGLASRVAQVAQAARDISRHPFFPFFFFFYEPGPPKLHPFSPPAPFPY